ncbi:hypothetical protein POM88_034301 [Heracleum sosnowskyi]|uniref:Uncharacterized protein n=1 Tax=Heracleum sosnowskyi TaxID=360622 RepID=A0AAD8MD10_9APIA|nr:hypothetical protein POM88_034301 [Heracleum sosnowskyi]
MRVQNPNLCNSFEGLENAESTWEKLRGQLYVHSFRWPGCKNCVRRVGPYSTPADQRLNAEQTSLQIYATAVNSKKASIEVIILDDGEDEDVVELTAALEELTRDEEKASTANGVTTDTLRKTEKRTRVKISSLKLKMMEKNSIDKPRRLEKPLVSHLALWETLRLKSKIMIRLRDFLSLHET